MITEANSERKAWIGEDVVLKENLLIRPHGVEVARLAAKSGSFPLELSEEEEDRFSSSMRSRYAQSGLHAGNYANMHALEAYHESDDPNALEFQFALTNLNDAPIFLPMGTQLLRFYVPPTEFIGNGGLTELLENQTIQIDGQEGADWKYVPNVGVALKIKEEGRGYVPPSREPISISGTEKQYREEIDRFLHPVSERRHPTIPVLWIGETVPVYLNDRVTAEIGRNAYPGFVGNTLRPTTGEHINSRLIDPSTGWPVRVEIFSPTEGPYVADWVIFRFFRQ